LLLKFADRLKDVGALEGLPKMEGKRMLVMFAPKAQQKQKRGSELGKLVERKTEEKAEVTQAKEAE
jgi:translation initiation factor IF-3